MIEESASATQSQALAADPAGSALPGGRYLSFSLGKEEYAIPLLSVREVIALPEITPVPQTPVHFWG